MRARRRSRASRYFMAFEICSRGHSVYGLRLREAPAGAGLAARSAETAPRGCRGAARPARGALVVLDAGLVASTGVDALAGVFVDGRLGPTGLQVGKRGQDALSEGQLRGRGVAFARVVGHRFSLTANTRLVAQAPTSPPRRVMARRSRRAAPDVCRGCRRARRPGGPGRRAGRRARLPAPMAWAHRTPPARSGPSESGVEKARWCTRPGSAPEPLADGCRAWRRPGAVDATSRKARRPGPRQVDEFPRAVGTHGPGADASPPRSPSKSASAAARSATAWVTRSSDAGASGRSVGKPSGAGDSQPWAACAICTTMPVAWRGWRKASFQSSWAEVDPDRREARRRRAGSMAAARSGTLNVRWCGPGPVAIEEAAQEGVVLGLPGLEDLDAPAVGEAELGGPEPDVEAARAPVPAQIDGVTGPGVGPLLHGHGDVVEHDRGDREASVQVAVPRGGCPSPGRSQPGRAAGRPCYAWGMDFRRTPSPISPRRVRAGTVGRPRARRRTPSSASTRSTPRSTPSWPSTPTAHSTLPARIDDAVARRRGSRARWRGSPSA